MRRMWMIVLIGCTANRAEAERALQLGAQTRQLTLEEQRAAATGLASLSCRDEDVCRVKTECGKVAEAAAAGLALRAELKAMAERPESERNTEDFQARADRLHEEATSKLQQASAAVPACETALAILGRSVHGK